MLMPPMRIAYSLFKSEQYPSAIAYIKEVIKKYPEAVQPCVAAGAVWGLLGDIYFKQNDIESGFAAYHKAIELDEGAGCLALFAIEVVKHNRLREAEFALDCLRASSCANWRALTKFPLHFISHSMNYRTMKRSSKSGRTGR